MIRAKSLCGNLRAVALPFIRRVDKDVVFLRKTEYLSFLASSHMKKLYGSVFLKGMLMGACDVVPGVSGGTIAFITGIYERLMNAIKAFSPALVKDGVVWIAKRNKATKQQFQKRIKELDLPFLLTLFAGIGVSLLLFSRVIVFLLENYFVYVMLFFIGLILASAKILYDNIADHRLTNIAFGVIGLAVGLSLLLLIPVRVEPSELLLFVSGFFGIFALFLPGISGAFILVIIGTYEHLIRALHNVRESIGDIFIFTLGAILGAFVISRLVTFLLKKHRSRTLYTLLGLVIGCLAIPSRQVIAQSTALTPLSVTLQAVCLIGGGTVVWGVYAIERRIKRKH